MSTLTEYNYEIHFIYNVRSFRWLKAFSEGSGKFSSLRTHENTNRIWDLLAFGFAFDSQNVWGRVEFETHTIHQIFTNELGKSAQKWYRNNVFLVALYYSGLIWKPCYELNCINVIPRVANPPNYPEVCKIERYCWASTRRNLRQSKKSAKLYKL